MKSKIEWCTHSINPVKGLCPVACPYCYARRMYKRFHWEQTIRYYPELLSPENMRKIPDGSKVFVGSTMELFGNWINEDWLGDIFDVVVSYPKLTFIFLTKKPENLIKWSPFPANCWVGVSATNNEPTGYGYGLIKVKASVKFISFEPLLAPIMSPGNYPESWLNAGINWLIIGQQTPVKVSTMPKIEWIKDIVDSAVLAGVPVFLKDNLKPLLVDHWNDKSLVLDWTHGESEFEGIVDLKLRQELPKVVKQ